MLIMAEHEIEGRRILLIERDNDDATEMGRMVEAFGGSVAGCVNSGIGAVSFARFSKVDGVMIHTETLDQIPFPLGSVMASLGVNVIPITCSEDWEEEEADEIFDDEVEPAFDMPTISMRSKHGREKRIAGSPDPRVMAISAKRPWP